MRLKPILTEKAKERQGIRTDLNIMLKSAPSLTESGKVRDELAKIAGVGHDTIEKVEKILEKGHRSRSTEQSKVETQE